MRYTTAAAFRTALELDAAVSLVAVLGRSASRWLPAIQTAVAYPMASRGRTGMTIAMFALVIFSVLTMRTINANFIAALLTDDAGAGWDVRVTASPSNPITDLDAALSESGAEVPVIDAVGRIETLDGTRGRLRNDGEESWSSYPINGMDTEFVDGSRLPLAARAPGYESDEAVWQAVRNGEDVAVLDVAAFETGGFGAESEDRYGVPDGVDITDGRIPAFEVELLDPRTGNTESFAVAGVIASRVSLLRGVFIGEQRFADVYGSGDVSNFYVQSHADAGEVADSIESALQARGVQAEAVDDMLEDLQANAISFFTLIQGFMALGLFVGIAGLHTAGVGDGDGAATGLPLPPPDWAVPYRRMANEVGLEPDMSVSYEQARRFLNPVLDGTCSEDSVWDPATHRWQG